jgi:hypothetical protein
MKLLIGRGKTSIIFCRDAVKQRLYKNDEGNMDDEDVVLAFAYMYVFL